MSSSRSKVQYVEGSAGGHPRACVLAVVNAAPEAARPLNDLLFGGTAFKVPEQLVPRLVTSSDAADGA